MTEPKQCKGCDSLNLSTDDYFICEETERWNNEYGCLVCEVVECLEQCPKGRW